MCLRHLGSVEWLLSWVTSSIFNGKKSLKLQRFWCSSSSSEVSCIYCGSFTGLNICDLSESSQIYDRLSPFDFSILVWSVWTEDIILKTFPWSFRWSFQGIGILITMYYPWQTFKDQQRTIKAGPVGFTSMADISPGLNRGPLCTSFPDC